MGLYIRPEYFHTIHYYFFCLGVFSLTVSLMFTAYNAYSYLFLAFYVANSAIAWYMSWFMHARMKLVFVIRSGKYMATHVILTVLSGGVALLLYWAFGIEFESVLTAFVMVNFFVIFLSLLWYVLAKLKIADRFFDWQEKGRLDIGREMMMRYRAKGGLKLVDDVTLKEYAWGADSAIDQLFMQVKMKASKGMDFSDEVRDIEIKLSERRIRELEGSIQNLKLRSGGKTDDGLMQSYVGAVKSREKGIMEYEKEVMRKKDTEGKA